ncbi:MAG: hypothetical protein PSV16_01855 [Flavobacterium sp.]|nr:hypothetical protein [Flavobacterium sp.]
MELKRFSPVLKSILITAILLGLHKLVFGFFLPEIESSYHFSLLLLYGFFGLCSALITLVSVILKKYSINSVGQVFLLTTFLQILACFAIFYAPINTSETLIPTEKPNFLIVFLLFLAIETILTVRLLNKNQ